MKPIITFLVVLAFIFGSPLIVLSQNAEQLYQKGLMQEEGEGNLQEAINIYNQIAQNENADISIRAKALLHVGLCYEKMGKEEATKAYQKLVNNFPSQKNEVAIARERLSKLILAVEEITKTPLNPKFTKIKIPTKLSWAVKLSPDGKKLAHVSDKKLWITPLSGNLGPDIPGTPVQLNTDGIEVEWTGLSWSQNGKFIAFNEYPQKDDKGKIIQNQKIFVIPSDGGKPREVHENYRDVRVVNYRISLSPDGKKMAFSNVEDKKQFIHTISIDGSNQNQLHDKQAREPVYSPDGNYIAFVEDKELGRGAGDLGLWVMPANGGTPQKIADAGKATCPVWSPDGSLIAYLDYTKGKQIFVVHFDKTNNKVQKPIAIEAPEGTEEVRLLAGWTPDNKIGALIVKKQVFGLYTLPAKGGQSALILNDVYALQPRFSLDGKQVFYVTSPKEGNHPMRRLALASVSAEGGNGKLLTKFPEGQELRQLAFQGGNRISPDGKSIISAAWIPDSISAKYQTMNSKIWKIPLDGSQPVQITNIQGPFLDGSPCWSPDGKKVAFVRIQLNDGGMDPFGDADIYIVDSAGGNPEHLISLPGQYINSLNWSPDGKSIAYLSFQKDAPNTKSMNVINVENGESRLIGEVPIVHVNVETAWSPDSKRIAFIDDKSKEIKVMSLSSGSIETINNGLVDVSIHHLDWSRDGKRFVFGGYKGGEAEFWFMEDFLPLDKLVQNEKTKRISKIMTNKKIWEDPDIDDNGEISPDGKYLSYTNWNTGDMAVFETASGEKRNLTNIGQGSNYDQFVYTSKWSPDGETLYYSYFILPDLFEIRSIELTDTEPKTICKFDGENNWLNIRDVSNDGKSILATLDINNETSQFIIISASTGNKNIVKEFPSVETDHLRFNDDASGIVYDYPQDDDSGNHDIYYLSINNGQITPLISHQANDFVLGLTSNNNRLVFGSSRSGKPSIWSIEYNSGKTIGNPQFIKTSDYRFLQGLGLSENGALVYCHFPSQTDIYETEINAESGKVITPPCEFTGNFVGANSTPDYSSNGKFMVYVSRRFPYDAKESFRPIGNVLCVQSLEDKSIREIKPEFSNFGFPKCSPDNRSVLVAGWDDYNSIGLYKIDIESGKSNPINLGQNRQFNHHEWSLDGKSVYLMCEGDSGKMEIVNHNLETGEEKILTTGSWKELYTISRSPDGKWIAFLGLDKNRTLNIIPANGGEIRKIHRWEHGDNRSIRHCWSADGKYIYLTKYKNPGQNLLWSLWQIPVDGSEPVNLGLDLTEIWQISAHPDGKHLAFSNEGEKHKSPEVWMLENFLPER